MSNEKTNVERSKVYGAIDSERLYQEDTQGGFEHDRKHTLWEWLAIVDRELAEAKGALLEGNEYMAKAEILQAAATLVACMEAKGFGVEPSHVVRIAHLKGTKL